VEIVRRGSLEGHHGFRRSRDPTRCAVCRAEWRRRSPFDLKATLVERDRGTVLVGVF
jgi:hypothetical protein